MIDENDFDFSKETKIKEELFIKMKTIASQEVASLSDEDLGLVQAARGEDGCDNLSINADCPYPELPCVQCHNYVSVTDPLQPYPGAPSKICAINCRKNG